MLYRGLQESFLLAAALTVLAFAQPTVGGEGRPIATTAMDAVQIKELTDADDKSTTAQETASSLVPKAAAPTKAKPKSTIAAAPSETTPPASPKAKPMAHNAPAKSALPTEATASPSKAKPKNAASSDDVAAMESVNVEAASFKGITPGVSTAEDVAKAWGTPKEIAKQGDDIVQLHSLAPFKRIEITISKGKVSSIVIRLERAYPTEVVAKQLALSTIRSVPVTNESGDVVGLAFPERGVSFALDPSTEPGKPSNRVSQLVMDPVSAEPFVLRAEATIETSCDLSRCDSEQALLLEPNNARANWLHARALAATEQFDKAAVAIARAVQLDSNDCRYRMTNAQVLAQMGRLPEALAEAKKGVELSGKRMHIKARALCLVGDLTASGTKPDYKQAISYHTQALQMADSLAADSHPAIRAAAKEVLIDAHLGAAHDIAWGDWKEKNKAVARWLERAVVVADDFVKNEGGSQERLFRVYVRAMAAYVGVRGEVDPEPTVNAVIATGDAAIADAKDPVHKSQLQWDLGMALYDAVQICQMRSEHENALKYGEKAAEYLAKANEVKQSTSSAFLLGRLYFRLGTIHAVRDKDHRTAVLWFDKAVPLLERPSPEELAGNLGRHGESFVSMAVSYWEAGQRQRAVALSEKGIKYVEQAVDRGMLDKSSLVVPYNNLAAMHRKLGSVDKADRFQELAGRVKQEKLK